MAKKKAISKVDESIVQDITAGAESFVAAEVASAYSRELLAGGARDISRGQDAAQVAETAAILSAVVHEAGIDDISEGAEMLAASEDIAVQSAVVSALSREDLAYGMELAAVSGQLLAASDVVTNFGMLVLADFLFDKGKQLQDISVETILRAGATRALSHSMQRTADAVNQLGVDEVEEGAARMNISDVVAARSEELAQAAVDLTVQGLVQVQASSQLRDVAETLVIDSAASFAQAGEKIGKEEAKKAK